MCGDDRCGSVYIKSSGKVEEVGLSEAIFVGRYCGFKKRFPFSIQQPIHNFKFCQIILQLRFPLTLTLARVRECSGQGLV